MGAIHDSGFAVARDALNDAMLACPMASIIKDESSVLTLFVASF